MLLINKNYNLAPVKTVNERTIANNTAYFRRITLCFAYYNSYPGFPQKPSPETILYTGISRFRFPPSQFPESLAPFASLLKAPGRGGVRKLQRYLVYRYTFSLNISNRQANLLRRKRQRKSVRLYQCVFVRWRSSDCR